MTTKTQRLIKRIEEKGLSTTSHIFPNFETFIFEVAEWELTTSEELTLTTPKLTEV